LLAAGILPAVEPGFQPGGPVPPDLCLRKSPSPRSFYLISKDD